jgi:hypothetical protein
MNTRNQVTVSVIKNKSGRLDTNIDQWIQFFKVHNFYANKSTKQIEHYLRKYRIHIAFRGEEVRMVFKNPIFLEQLRKNDQKLMEIDTGKMRIF